MAKQSAGILLYRRCGTELEVLLVHPGGPFWTKKDLGAWSIPKGEYASGDDALTAAKREFQEETGFEMQPGELLFLSEVRLTSGKVITAWAVEGDCNADAIRSNTFSLEWPPKSGKIRDFPEVDRAGWFGLEVAGRKVHPAQRPFFNRLAEFLNTQQAAKPTL
jgi:predicted NUDIX family NTP pyrophosphohydrolase